MNIDELKIGDEFLFEYLGWKVTQVTHAEGEVKFVYAYCEEVDASRQFSREELLENIE